MKIARRVAARVGLPAAQRVLSSYPAVGPEGDEERPAGIKEREHEQQAEGEPDPGLADHPRDRSGHAAGSREANRLDGFEGEFSCKSV